MYLDRNKVGLSQHCGDLNVEVKKCITDNSIRIGFFCIYENRSWIPAQIHGFTNQNTIECSRDLEMILQNHSRILAQIHGFVHRFTDSGTDSRILVQIPGFQYEQLHVRQPGAETRHVQALRILTMILLVINAANLISIDFGFGLRR